ncbi:hypothetical protein BBJ28_00024465 [Nothophytophthora sp. Chile5]|nr:hypothetical protein BBJ28_00024465 [Nothophytophthora sp. Chile5]
MYSNDPSQHSHALGFLGQLVKPAAAAMEYEFVSGGQALGLSHPLRVVVDGDKFHTFGTNILTEDAFSLGRSNNMSINAVYAETSLIHENPRRDMPFLQMPRIKGLDVKFCVDFPVLGSDGEVVASICAADTEPHNNFSAKDHATTEALDKLTSILVVPKNTKLRKD